MSNFSINGSAAPSTVPKEEPPAISKKRRAPVSRAAVGRAVRATVYLAMIGGVLSGIIFAANRLGIMPNGGLSFLSEKLVVVLVMSPALASFLRVLYLLPRSEV